MATITYYGKDLYGSPTAKYVPRADTNTNVPPVTPGFPEGSVGTGTLRRPPGS